MHILLKCPCLNDLNDLRQNFISRHNYNIIRMFKPVEWLKSENRNVLIKL